MTDTITTVVGNLTADPELRFTPSGAPVANFTVASTPRKFDRATNEWKDEEALFMRCSVWREVAENLATSLHKGDRVIVQGKVKQRSWEKDGERRTSVELEVIEVGPSVRYATVNVTRTPRNGNGPSGNYGDGNRNGGASTSRGPVDDPWGAAPTGGGMDSNEEPPF